MSAGLQVMDCPPRPDRFLVNTQMKSLRQCVLPDWKPNPPWRDAHRPPDTAVPLQGWPRTPTPFLHARFPAQVSRCYTVMPRCFTSSSLSESRGRTHRLLDAPPTLCQFVGRVRRGRGITRFLGVELIMQRLSAAPDPNL